MYSSIQALLDAAKEAFVLENEKVVIKNEKKLRDGIIDWLIKEAIFNENETIVKYARSLISKIAKELGAYSASIQILYDAMGNEEVGGFSVPAINLRGLTYDMSRTVFRAGMKLNVGPIIFEIAKSEIGYTYQRPSEYTACVLAAAIKEGWKGPVFIQGDHFQVKASKYKENPEKEIEGVKDIIKEAIAGEFYNIDLDTSTLVDLSYETLDEQQKDNYTIAAELTKYIRELEPEGITISVGGEIGEIGTKNSTPAELRAYMDGYKRVLGETLKGISKMSVQTGTAHGGVVLPDGSIADVKVDFETLKKLGEVARNEYGLSGAVQHGASTLPDEAFHNFPEVKTAEIHLATGFQNIIYDHKLLPADFREKIYAYLRENFAKEKKEGQTEEQFIYKTRKKGFGPFKQEWWDLSRDILDPIMMDLQIKFEFLFKQLKVENTLDMLKKYFD